MRRKQIAHIILCYYNGIFVFGSGVGGTKNGVLFQVVSFETGRLYAKSSVSRYANPKTKSTHNPEIATGYVCDIK